MAKKNLKGIVYSTNSNFQFQYEEEPEKETLLPGKQDLRVRRDSKHRGGKMVTLITGFQGTEEDMEVLARKLKTQCGTGGSCKDGEIVIQGDVREKICEILTKDGYKFKKAGG
ncbi:MAG: translation initiation factor [Bacteroidales bacterium]